MSNPQSKKWCVVPMCPNTTKNAPEKLFFVVPFEPKTRKKWMQLMKRANPPGAKSCVYCCEDHFDIESDMENYVKFKLVGGRIKLKKEVVPHKFECQKPIKEKSERSAVHKRNQIKLLEKLFHDDPIPSTSAMPEEVFVACCNENDVIDDPLEDKNNQSLEKSINHKAVQVRLKNKVGHKATITEEKYFKKEKNNTDKKSTILYKQQIDTVSICSFTDTSSITSVKHDIMYEKDSSSPSESDETECEKAYFKQYMEKAALMCISKEPQLLLGIPQQCYFCINILSETTHCTPRNIMITLKKVRLHQSNAILALDFGLSISSVATIIRRTIPAIAFSMKSLIFFPSSQDVRLNLPIPFRRRYAHVQSIVDCFEIQIEKPVDAVKQALTWSDYKSCNTIKYLISITPDGLINFISEGYGGRATDSTIFEDCGILQALPKGAAVLADRGFKNIAHLLQQHGFTLIRPPSVSAQAKPTKKEVLETKKIAALWIHVERAIGRLRGFGFMLPHACVDLKQVDLLDFIVFSACGIVNLQSCLFSTN